MRRLLNFSYFSLSYVTLISFANPYIFLKVFTGFRVILRKALPETPLMTLQTSNNIKNYSSKANLSKWPWKSWETRTQQENYSRYRTYSKSTISELELVWLELSLPSCRLKSGDVPKALMWYHDFPLINEHKFNWMTSWKRYIKLSWELRLNILTWVLP